MRNNRRYLTTFGFIDLLFNMLVGFVFMFFIAYILINPIADEGKVTPPDEAVIVINWPDNSKYDIDVWIKDPNGLIMSFTNKTIPGMHLEKDDLGFTGDSWKGSSLAIKNQEVVHITHLHEGVYNVSLHLYATHGVAEDQKVTVEFMTIKKFKKLGSKQVIMSKKGQEVPILSFDANDKQQITEIDWDFAGSVVDFNTLQASQLPEITPGRRLRIGEALP